MSEKARRTLWTLLKFGVTVGLLSYLAQSIELDQALELAASAHPGSVVLAMAMVAAQQVIIALRWRFLASMKAETPTYGRFFRWTMEGLFFNQTLPSSVGGDAIRIFRLARDGGLRVSHATSSVLLDRAFGLLGIVLIAAIFLPTMFHLITDPVMQQGVVLLLAAGLGGFAFFLILDGLPPSVRRWKIVAEFLNMSKQARHVLLSPPLLAKVGLSTAAGQTLALSAFYVLAQGLDVNVAYGVTMAVLPVAILIATIPVTIAGWGLREGVLIVALSYAAVSEPQALALSVLYGLVHVAVGLPGGLFWLMARTKAEKPETQSPGPAA
ncbi:lysylphosphatidylglycerol synthase transmembrane domain-containing protein [Hwanghaeella sp.]|uniref:lysylphosphatidylglycerol synthase transmembrane domain-containing protein n=1 Tax=Hwanghaeella sp. TaxID=2605943 RepID=UPI003CCB9CC5